MLIRVSLFSRTELLLTRKREKHMVVCMLFSTGHQTICYRLSPPPTYKLTIHAYHRSIQSICSGSRLSICTVHSATERPFMHPVAVKHYGLQAAFRAYQLTYMRLTTCGPFYSTAYYGHLIKSFCFMQLHYPIFKRSIIFSSRKPCPSNGERFFLFCSTDHVSKQNSVD